ncbi:MAG: histidine phosphatase family protein [Chloroflexi bacterium]|nr:histidine phosphatase family protein [Chloroflexota bacterium]
MRFYFVRHGESEANILHEMSNRGWKHGLTEKGREQAAALAYNLHSLDSLKHTKFCPARSCGRYKRRKLSRPR